MLYKKKNKKKNKFALQKKTKTDRAENVKTIANNNTNTIKKKLNKVKKKKKKKKKIANSDCESN